MEIACNKKKSADADFYIFHTSMFMSIYLETESVIDLRYSAFLLEKYKAVSTAVFQYLTR